MKYRVLFSDAAEADVAALLDYLVPRAGERIARDYVDRIIDYCADFETFPERGLGRNDISPGLRIVGYRRKASIAFQVRDNVVTILRIYFGGRNIALSDFEENG